MTDNTDKDLGTDKASYQVPQVIYGYPAPTNTNDEIDLGELIKNLAAQYKLIVGITLLGTLLSLAVALYLPNIYRQEVILSKPHDADIAELNANGYTKFTTQKIFKQYYDILRSPHSLELFIKEAGFLQSLYPETNRQENTLIAEFYKKFKIEILEPKPDLKNGVVIAPSMIAIRVDHEKEEVIVNLLNEYTRYTEKKFIKSLSEQQKVQIESELKTIVRDIELLRSAEKLAREDEIIKLEEKNKNEISAINNKIEALLVKADTDKSHEIIAMDSAYKIAKKLGIKKPTSIADIGKNFQGLTSKTEITMTDKQELPLYLMGTEYLDAKREDLNVRTDNAPFIREYTSLKEQIKLLENDAKLTSLKNRSSDDPYITELPALIARKHKIERLSLVFNGVKAMKIEKNAKITGEKIKPKRAVIVIVGVIISGMISLFVGIIAAVIVKKPVK